MYSALVFATFVLSTFAAPVPQPSDENVDIHGCWRSINRRDAQVDSHSAARARKACKISHPRDGEGYQDVEVTLETRGAQKNEGRSPNLSRPKGSHGSGKIQARGTVRNDGVSHGSKPKGFANRPNGRRDLEEEEDFEVRAIRNESKRNAEPQPVIRPGRGGKGGGKRAEDDVEARVIVNEGLSHGSKPKAKNLNARSTISNESKKRDAEPEPVVRPNKDTKRAEEDTEQAIGGLLNESAGEADPYTRKHDSYRRYAEAGITGGNDSYRRSADPEPAVTHGGAEAGYRSQTCHPGLISSRC